MLKSFFAVIAAATALTSLPAMASIDAFPSFIRFNDTVVGRRSFPEQVTITNRGPDDVSFLSVYPTCGGSFYVSTGSCFGSLRPYQSCYIQVSFTPMREGYDSCNITVRADGWTDFISVSGRGIERPFAKPAVRATARPMPARK